MHASSENAPDGNGKGRSAGMLRTGECDLGLPGLSIEMVIQGVVERLSPRLTRLYPLYRGRGRLALSSFLRRHGYEAAEPILVSLLTGESIYVPENDYIGRMVRFFGDLDPAVSSVVRGIVRPGDVVIDVGANVGIVTLQVASIVGTGGHVFAFEPVKRLSTLLSRSVTENGFRNITVLNLALSDVAGRGSMKVSDGSLGCSRLDHHVDGEPCEVTTMDVMDFGVHFRRPRLLKIDVEGYESKVLAGGRAFIEKGPPDYVLFESHADRGQFWDRPEVRILQEHGYSFAAILRSAFARPVVREVFASDASFTRTYDFLATHERVGG
jgi:FkbM family methyltransferase